MGVVTKIQGVARDLCTEESTAGKTLPPKKSRIGFGVARVSVLILLLNAMMTRFW